MQTILMIGLGKIGLPVAKQLAVQGHCVIGVSRRTPIELSLFDDITNQRPQQGLPLYHVAGDARTLSISQLTQWAGQINQICIMVSPDTQSVQGYQDSYYAIADNVVKLSDYLPKLKRVTFISSTGVYGQNAGEIIDISTPVLLPISPTSKVILQAEQLLQQHFGEDCVIIRPSGIYGESRLRLVTLARQLAAQPTSQAYPVNGYPSNTWTNRVMDTDLGAVIINVINAGQTVPIYLTTDNAPVPLYTVLNYLATAQGLRLSLPSHEPLTGKRIINNLPSTWLGYPDWQSGYQHIMQTLHD